MPFILGVLIIIAVGLIRGLRSLIEDIKYKVESYSKTKKIKKSLSKKDEKLNELLKQVIVFFLISMLCGIIGYLLATYTSSNIKKLIILGICCPWGYIVVDKFTQFLYKYFKNLYELLSLVTFGIFAVLCFILKVIASSYIGVIALPIVIIYFFIALIKISKES